MTTVQIHQGDCLAILPTLAAGSVAINNGRAFVGCELNPDYVELAYRRIAKTQLPLLEAEYDT